MSDIISTQYFHFSLGPVQSFIAQARRTRDFWAGSFILSWLSAVAIQAVIEQNGTIDFPEPDNDYLLWLKGEGKYNRPEHGGVPNRFKASVKQGFKPEAVVNAVNQTWKALADKVYEGDLANAGDKTKEIWERQVACFWEMSWVIIIINSPLPSRKDDITDSSAMDVRKNWRSYLPPDEKGVKCMMMDGWQELSGADKPTAKVLETFWKELCHKTGKAYEPKEISALNMRENWRTYLPPELAGMQCMMMDAWQKLSITDKPKAKVSETFWQSLRENGNKGIKTDLRPNESLCAIGFIKRRFVRYFDLVEINIPVYDEKLKDQIQKSWKLKGWEVKAGRPSVAYMAAVHWLKNVLIQAQSYPDVADQLWRFHDEALELTKGDYPGWDNQIACIKRCDTTKKWKALDGNVFFESALENANIFENQDQAKHVVKELRELQKRVKLSAPDLQPATPFYAVLMMDGDSLGKQMSNKDKQGTITQGLKNFTDSVPNLVAENNGFLIYAGGDDVLAVLPLEDALPCALAIREKYECVFASLNKLKAEENRVSTSISAAVVFAPIKMPLMKVLKEAHALLDKVAKDEYGRDALAVSVWKPGGRVLQWARPWHEAITDDGRQLVLERLARDFADDDKDYGQLSNKFFYKIRERFELLNPPPDKPDKKSEKKTPVLDSDQAIDLMAAEYISSGLCEDIKEPSKRLAHAKAVVAPLLEQCRPVYRKLDENDKCSFHRSDHVRVDAALLVRFLAQKGVNL